MFMFAAEFRSCGQATLLEYYVKIYVLKTFSSVSAYQEVKSHRQVFVFLSTVMEQA
jgi:hypothetical protein